jgi:hypothetical protein
MEIKKIAGRRSWSHIEVYVERRDEASDATGASESIQENW